jgi:hypothetical protein
VPVPKAVTVLALVFLLAGCASSPQGAGPAAFATCIASVPVTPEGSSASEVSMAIDPLDPRHIVAAANGGGGFAVYTSLDGGANWTAEQISALELAQDGQYVGVGISLSDPSVAFSPDGTLHIAGLNYIPASSVVVFNRASTDGPWAVSTVWRSEVAGTFNDKEWLAVDPATGTMVVAWQREPVMDSLRTAEQSSNYLADLDLGLIVVSRSTDGGATWSVPQQVSGDPVTGGSLHNNGTQVVFTEDGRAHLVWVDYEAPGLVHSVSTDQGATWSTPAPISDLNIAHAFGGFTRMHTLPGLAQSGDQLAAVWHDARDDPADIRVSLYDGTSWSASQRVPDGEVGSGTIQVYPWAAFDETGALHVTFYSGEVDGDFTYRTMALRDGAWSEPMELGATFDIVASDGGVANLGDYTAAAAAGSIVHAAWAQPDAGGNAVVHVSTATRLAACPEAVVI